MGRRRGPKAGKKSPGPRCKVCNGPLGRGGWCERCRNVRRAIAAALGETDDLGHRAAEAFDAARRVELHRGRGGHLDAYLRTGR